MTKQHIPKIRFQGFDEEWGESTLDTLLSYEQPTNYIVTSTDYSNEFSTPVLTAGQSFLLGYTDEEFGIKKASDENPVIIFDDFTTGSHFVNFDFKIKSSAMKLLITNNNFEPYFTFYKLRTIKYEPTAHERHWISKFSQFLVHFPSLLEQESIGQLFRTLDELISAYKDNLEHYQSLKTSMLSKMFPKEGQKQPEIRLDGFEGDWEVRQIKEFSEVVRGASPRPIQNPKWFDSNSDIGWLRISDVTKQEGKIYYLEQKLSREGQLKTRVLTTPHLLLSIAASVGKPVINYVKTGVHDGFLIFLNPKFNIDFMFFWLEMFKDGWNKYGQPGSQVNLNKDIVRNHYLHLPSLPEQEAIGAFFANLDETISSYKDKIGQLELLKKNLLSQMFI